MSKTEKHIGHYPNGKKRVEVTLKDGKEDGLYTSWYENGQKLYEGTYKNGERVGLGTMWHENGKRKWEITYKDGKFISSIHWDEYGHCDLYYNQ